MTLAADDLASIKTAPAHFAEPLLIELFGEPTAKRRRELESRHRTEVWP